MTLCGAARPLPLLLSRPSSSLQVSRHPWASCRAPSGPCDCVVSAPPWGKHPAWSCQVPQMVRGATTSPLERYPRPHLEPPRNSCPGPSRTSPRRCAEGRRCSCTAAKARPQQPRRTGRTPRSVSRIRGAGDCPGVGASGPTGHKTHKVSGAPRPPGGPQAPSFHVYLVETYCRLSQCSLRPEPEGTRYSGYSGI